MKKLPRKSNIEKGCIIISAWLYGMIYISVLSIHMPIIYDILYVLKGDIVQIPLVMGKTLKEVREMMVYTIAPVASILLLIVWKPNVIYDKVSEHKRILNKTKAFILFLVFTVFFSGIIYYLYLKRYLM